MRISLRRGYRSRARSRRRVVKSVPLKTKLLRALMYEIGSTSLINDPAKIRKALRTIVDDETMWEKLASFGKEVKALAKYGIEQGY